MPRGKTMPEGKILTELETMEEAAKHLRCSRLLKMEADGDVLNVVHWNDVKECISLPPGLAGEIMSRLEAVWSWMPDPIRQPDRQSEEDPGRGND